MIKRILGIVVCGSLLSACATAPDKVAGTYVSPMLYSTYDCSQIQMELHRVSYQVASMAAGQAQDRRRDAVAWGVGMFIAWPALVFLAEGDHKDELALYKGQYDALSEAAIQKKCMVAQEQAADRAVAESRGIVGAAPAEAVPAGAATSVARAAPADAGPRVPHHCGLYSPTDPSAMSCSIQ